MKTRVIRISQENVKFLESMNAGTINNAIIVLREYYKIESKLKEIKETQERIECRINLLPLNFMSKSNENSLE